ncbi:hypothetical protein F5Y13DRAFT_87600 [Hypoxylon sp. FL1857]|nr:hypothetical protein F5Y13DRAFT_87600 [Hypoxylon sp. FL1857]
MANLGTLTTTFMPSGVDCASTFVGIAGDNMWIQYGVGGSASSACYPSNFIPQEKYYYSPGICPSGYATACEISSPGASATTVTCCPPEFSCHDGRGDDPFACTSFFADPKAFAVSTFSFAIDSAGSTTSVHTGSTTMICTNNWVFAYGPVVHFELGEIPTDPSDSGMTMPIVDREGSPYLSTGAIVGIGIGSGLGVIALTAAVIGTFIRRRRRRVQSEATTQRAYEGDKPQQDHHPQQPLPHELNEERVSHAHELCAERE